MSLTKQPMDRQPPYNFLRMQFSSQNYDLKYAGKRPIGVSNYEDFCEDAAQKFKEMLLAKREIKVKCFKDPRLYQEAFLFEIWVEQAE